MRSNRRQRLISQMLTALAVYLLAFAFNTILTCGVFLAENNLKYNAISVFFAAWCFVIPLAPLGCFAFYWPDMPV